MNSKALRSILPTAMLVLLCISSGAAQTRESRSPIQWAATFQQVEDAKQPLKLSVKLRATISPGWHLYAMNQELNGPMRTAIQVPAGQPFTLSGTVQQSQPLVRFDPNLGGPVHYFEDEAVFRVPLAATPGVKSRAHTVTVAVSFQTCNDRLCLPPTTVRLEATIPK